jgi:hypothetical protein
MCFFLLPWSFWMLTSLTNNFFINGVVSKRHQWPLLTVLRVFYRQRMSIALHRHWWPPSTILYVFYRQRVLIPLQRAQATSILRCVVIASEGFSKLMIFLGFSYSFWYASYNWGGIWNMICFTQTWILFLCPLFSPFSAALFYWIC